MRIYNKEIIKKIKEIREFIYITLAEHQTYSKYTLRYTFHIFFTNFPNKTLGTASIDRGNAIIYLDYSLLSDEAMLKNVVKHELAHILSGVEGHSERFRSICRELGTDEEFCFSKLKRAKTASDKIKKLLALSSSSNIHESELALKKARELMGQQTIETASDKETIYADLIEFNSNRVSVDTKTIIIILQEFFFVYPVMTRSFKTGKKACQISGSESSVEIALYVYDFLNTHKNYLWKMHKKENPTADKRSYLIGLMDSFFLVLKEEKKKELVKSNGTELIKVESDLAELSRQLLYPSLSKGKRSNIRVKPDSYGHGMKDGKNIKIKKSINEKSSKTLMIGNKE